MDFCLILIHATLLLAHCSIAVAKCSAKSCSEAFLQRVQSVREDSDDYCIYLHAYSKCISLQQDSCRGDINYYGTQSAIELLKQKHSRCSNLLKQNDLFEERAKKLATQKVEIKANGGKSCRYTGISDMSHCALFGDPHLVTFNSDHHTCIIKGAWPLLSTKHLAIQVTNEAFANNRIATAVTKVTVVIKAMDSCGSGVTYEASDDLPRAFVDGRTWTKTGWVDEVVPEKHVIVNVPVINATVGIRKIHNFYQVLVSLPTEVAITDSEDVNLCINGCPLSQKVSFHQEQIFKTLSENDAAVICSKFNLTDDYLDSCMFDLMTTGDESFGKTASLAQKDMTELNSRYVSLKKNCTQWPCEWTVSQSNLLSNLNLFSTIVIFIIAFTMR